MKHVVSPSPDFPAGQEADSLCAKHANLPRREATLPKSHLETFLLPLLDQDMTDEQVIREMERLVQRNRELVKNDEWNEFNMTPCYSVKELAERLNTSGYNIRYYDQEHLFPYVQRDKKGRRMFSPADQAYGEMLTCLRSLGLPVQYCRRFFLYTLEGDITVEKRLAVLQFLADNLQNQILELQEAQRELQYKISFFCAVTEQIRGKDPEDLRTVALGSLHNLRAFVQGERLRDIGKKEYDFARSEKQKDIVK